MGIFDRVCHRLQAALHRACGRAWFRLGRPQRARHHFERVLLLRGEDFDAYVQLGRIAFAIGDYAGWRRELRHAHRIDPVRFARLLPVPALQRDLAPRLAGTGIDLAILPRDGSAAERAAAERATWSFPTGLPGQLFPNEPALPPHDNLAAASDLFGSHRTADAAVPGFDPDLDALLPLAENAAIDDLGDEPVEHGDDFVSGEERDRFTKLQPIRRSDVQDCNLDELLRRLSG